MQREKLTDEELQYLHAFEREMWLCQHGGTAMVGRVAFTKILAIYNRVYHAYEVCGHCSSTRHFVLTRMGNAYFEDYEQEPAPAPKKRAPKKGGK